MGSCVIHVKEKDGGKMIEASQCTLWSYFMQLKVSVTRKVMENLLISWFDQGILEKLNILVVLDELDITLV